MPHDYRWISKHDPKVQAAYANLMSLLQDVHHDLQYYSFQHRVVGSYKRNMITYDAKSNTGFDLDVNIYPDDPDESLSPKEIKLRFKTSLDKFGCRYGFAPADDSTRVLTIKAIDYFSRQIYYSIDFAFVFDYRHRGIDRQQYVHFHKNAAIPYYSWAEQSKGFYRQEDKINWLKKRGLWNELRDDYIDKKNRNTDPDCHSRSIFAKAINELCQKHGYNG